MFNPGLKIGQIVKNADIVEIFKCGNMGGMRRSKTTNTLVIVSDYTKGLYHDKWIGGVLHYTGMGKSGDQDLYWSQNATLAESGFNGVDVHLFEVMDAGEYVYCGRIELVDKPYADTQPGEVRMVCQEKYGCSLFGQFRIMTYRSHKCLYSKIWSTTRHAVRTWMKNIPK